MKTILQINILNDTGSTGRIMQGISKVIQENGMNSYTAYGYGNSDRDNSIRIGSKIDYYIHNVFSRVFCNQGKYSYLATKKFLEKVEKIKPDIIHLHNIHGNYINYGLLFKYIVQNDIGVVWTFHDCWPFTGRCAYYQLAKCDQWKNGCIRCKNTKDYPASLFKKNVEKQFSDKKHIFTKLNRLCIVTPSEWLSREVKKSFLSTRDVRVINNGINTSVFKYQPGNFKMNYGLQNNFLILGIAHSWDKRKGLEDFIKMSDLLKEDEKIVLVGLSEKQTKNLPTKILGISKTESIQQLAEIYSESDVFVNFTYEDNFPTVNLEAMSCKLPVFTYNTGGSVESVLSSDYIVEQGDVDSMYKKISYYRKLENKECIKEACVNKIHQNYQQTVQFEKYMDVYRGIVGEE